MSKQATSANISSGHRPTRSELRASLVWPVIIAVAIWLVGLVIWIVVPGRFDTAVSAVIAAGLIIYLGWYQRALRLTRWERLVSMVLAVPAVLGIAYGLIYGQALYAITGVSASLLMLSVQRAFTVPLSYRLARRNFLRGNLEMALDLTDKAIAARPGFWESYQLRALIYLAGMRFGQAERDALKALELRPDAHPVYNTLGQLHLAEANYEKAATAYAKAISLSPKHALYHLYHGMALYRMNNARDAAESLAAATRLGLPVVTFELLAYYYLGRALEGNREVEKAEEIFIDMLAFRDGLDGLKSELAQQPDFPELPHLRSDLRDMERRLAAAKHGQTL